MTQGKHHVYCIRIASLLRATDVVHGGFADANESLRSDVERENNWISVEGLTVDESYSFTVTAQDAEGEQATSEPRIFALRMRTGK